MRPLLIALIAATTLLMGCAFTTANLDIEHTEAEAHKGPMSRVEPTAFWIEPLEDQRKDKARIGYKRNGFGMETADVISKRPVPDIVRDALINTIRANDHTLSESEPQLLVRGEVTEFWYDLDVNFWTVEFMGSVSTHLKFINPQVDEVIYERAYDGNYNEKSAGGYHGTMERVIRRPSLPINGPRSPVKNLRLASVRQPYPIVCILR